MSVALHDMIARLVWLTGSAWPAKSTDHLTGPDLSPLPADLIVPGPPPLFAPHTHTLVLQQQNTNGPTLAAFLALLTGWMARSQVVMVTSRQMVSQYMTHSIWKVQWYGVDTKVQVLNASPATTAATQQSLSMSSSNPTWQGLACTTTHTQHSAGTT